MPELGSQASITIAEGLPRYLRGNGSNDVNLHGNDTLSLQGLKPEAEALTTRRLPELEDSMRKMHSRLQQWLRSIAIQLQNPDLPPLETLASRVFADPGRAGRQIIALSQAQAAALQRHATGNDVHQTEVVAYDLDKKMKAWLQQMGIVCDDGKFALRIPMDSTCFDLFKSLGLPSPRL